MKRKTSNSTANPPKRYKLLDYSYSRRPEAQVLQAEQREIMLARRVGKTDLKMTTVFFQNSVDNIGTIQNIYANLVRGTGMVDNYLGSEILPTSVRERMSIAMGPNALANGDGTNVIRVILFQWFDASVPVVNGVLESISPYAPISWQNRKLIKVLSDKLYGTKQAGDPSLTYDLLTDSIYIKSKKMKPTRFNNAGTNAQEGGLYALFLSDSSVVAHPFVSSQLTVTFTDS